jgi:hypothetical protein
MVQPTEAQVLETPQSRASPFGLLSHTGRSRTSFSIRRTHSRMPTHHG